MEKLSHTTESIINENVERLAALFPEVVTEVREPDGSLRHTIDVDALRERVGDVAEGQRERYQFTWPGKREAKQEAYRQIDKCLRPCPEESVNWDTTQNLYIEGDNLDALKLLRNTYAGKVKMIYIDPPYNTGHDFIYDDDFSRSKADYDADSGDYDEEGGRLVANPESNGRFHSDWCSMMYPRLLIARDLLTADGAIFISIDNNEISNLIALCDSIFGRSSFVTVLHVEMSTTQGMKVKAAKQGNIVKNGEFIVVYSRSGRKNLFSSPIYDPVTYDSHYSLFLVEDGDSYIETQLSDELSKHKEIMQELSAIGLIKAGENRFSSSLLSKAYGKSEQVRNWVNLNADHICRVHDSIEIERPSNECRSGHVYKVESGGRGYLVSFDGKKPTQRILLSEKLRRCGDFFSTFGPSKIRGDWWPGFYLDMGNISKEGGVSFPDGKKPVRLLFQIICACTEDSDIVMDFFSGSATAAHAVMQANTDGDGSRRFIMVQLPEVCDEKSEAAKAGYKTICEIGKERIRRAGRKIAAEAEESNRQLKLGEEPRRVPDVGFRVLKIDSSNFEDVSVEPGEFSQDAVLRYADNLKLDRTPDDLIIQVMLKKQIELSASIEKLDVDGCTVFSVDGGRLIACFDRDVSVEVMTAMAKMEPDYAVMRDASFAGDDAVSNFAEIFKNYSSVTEVEVI